MSDLFELRRDRFTTVFGERRGSGRPAFEPGLVPAAPGTRYPSLVAFYAADRQGRERSPEADYGVDWHGPDGVRGWRVTYCGVSGEVYAVCARRGSEPQVIVLGHVPADRDPFDSSSLISYYATLDRLLSDGTPDSWTAHMNDPDGLAWLQARLRS